MTKKMVLIALVSVMAVAAVFAAGRRDWKDNDNSTAAERKADLLAKIDTLTTASYTGPITVSNRRFPELAAGDTVYRLVMFPMFRWFDLQVKDGDTVTVQAAKITDELINQFREYPGPGMMYGRNGSDNNNRNQVSPLTDGSYLLVTRLTVNGQTYDLKEAINQDQFQYGYGRMPGRGGRMGGFCW